jgi:DNA-binding Lrp family transcriptional regulator
MPEKLDLKDKKILYLLLENSRLNASEIAKYVGLSKNAVSYRIDRLLKNNIIWKFFPIFDFHKVGVYSYDLFIKLKATKEEEEKIKEYFRNHPNVVWATTLFGKWDLFVQVIAKDMWDFEAVLDKIVEFLGEKLDSYDAKLMVKRAKIDHQLFDVKIDYKFKPAKPDYSKIYKLDALDKKILIYLNEKNAIAQYATIANAVGASLETVRNRIRGMLKEGVITRFFPFVRHENIGLVRYLVMIDFRHLTKEMEQKVTDYVIEQRGINLAFKTVGKPEMYFWVIGEKPSDIEAMMKKMQSKFFNVITKMEPMLTTEELTLNFFPKVVESLK